MNEHEEKAMLEAWDKECDTETAVHPLFQEGFEAALAMQKKPKWTNYTQWWNNIDKGVGLKWEEIWEAARK